MDRGDHKLYHVHGVDSRTHLDTYLSKEDEGFVHDFLKFPISKLHSTLNNGHITGDILVDISFGSFIHHLYSACDFFKEITLLRASEKCILELNKWLNTRTGAFDWSHTSEILADISGNSDQSQDKNMRLKAAIKKIMKCDVQKENLIEAEMLHQADCVITAGFLDFTSENQKDYERTLKKISNLLKPGGHLVFIGAQNSTYLMVGEEKVHILKYDETYARKALTDEGFTIDDCEVHNRKSDSDLSDYEGMIFIAAHKEK